MRVLSYEYEIAGISPANTPPREKRLVTYMQLSLDLRDSCLDIYMYEQQHDISNNVVYETSNGSDQPAHTRSLIRAFAGRLDIL